MSAITARTPNTWQELEDTVTAILSECGMNADRHVEVVVPRGSIWVDVLAKEYIDGIAQTLVCECKLWKSNIPAETVRHFRTVMQETGAHRGHIISKIGFQSGAVEAAISTNIDLLTFDEFQSLYFDKWLNARLWYMEREIGNFNTYYEPLGRPGYSKLSSDEDRIAYDDVWNEYLFTGLILQPFSPFIRMRRDYPIPSLPLDVSDMESRGVRIPNDIKAVAGYRELFELLQEYARVGLSALREVNPVTRGKRPDDITRDD